MREIDQAMRKKNLADDTYWDHSIDRNNTARMKEIVQQIGWPCASKVGKDGALAAWLLVQHVEQDIPFQIECLALMKVYYLNSNEVQREHIALLEDRILVNSGQRQRYGTQFDGSKKNLVPRPIEDEQNVDLRRAEMGLGTLKDGIAAMHAKYGTR